jgi:hypothetical protein
VCDPARQVLVDPPPSLIVVLVGHWVIVVENEARLILDLGLPLLGCVAHVGV